MVWRLTASIGLVLFVVGCDTQRSERPVIRLNLDEIAVATAQRDSIEPGFASF